MNGTAPCNKSRNWILCSSLTPPPGNHRSLSEVHLDTWYTASSGCSATILIFHPKAPDRAWTDKSGKSLFIIHIAIFCNLFDDGRHNNCKHCAELIFVHTSSSLQNASIAGTFQLQTPAGLNNFRILSAASVCSLSNTPVIYRVMVRYTSSFATAP